MADLSSTHRLLAGWAPQQYGGRTIVRVEKLRGSTRRITFDRGRVMRVNKSVLAKLARQKGTILAGERYAGLSSLEKRRMTRKGVQRQRSFLQKHIDQVNGLVRNKIVKQSKRLKQAMAVLRGYLKRVRPGYGKRRGKTASEAIDAAWEVAGQPNPVGR